MPEQRRLGGAIVLALAVAVLSQILRLHQTAAWSWLLCDYGGRLASLFVLYLVAETREFAFTREPLRVDGLEVGGWMLALIALQLIVVGALEPVLNAAFAGSVLNHYPRPTGALYLFDMTLGLALVALHEEILFRRCLRRFIGEAWQSDFLMTIAAAALFALYHWQHGVGSMAGAFLFGVAAMSIYRRIGALAPIVVAHYAVNAILFA